MPNSADVRQLIRFEIGQEMDGRTVDIIVQEDVREHVTSVEWEYVVPELLQASIWNNFK